MSGIPTVKIELYDPTYLWYDVSEWVDMVAGVKAQRGRSSLFDSSAPGTLSFTMFLGIVGSGNEDHWAVGSTESNLYLKKNVPVRVTVGGVQVWEGYIDSVDWRFDESHPMNTRIRVECTDEFKKYARTVYGPYGVERQHTTMGTFTSGATYPLALPRNGVGSFWHAHRDPTASPIRIYGATAGHYETSEDGPPFIKSCVKMVPWSTIGPWWEHPTTFDPGADKGVVSIWFRTSESASGAYLFKMFRTSGGTGYFQGIIDSAGDIVVTVVGDTAGSKTVTASGDWRDGAWHHLAVKSTVATGTTLDVYIDGSLNVSGNTGGTAATIGSSNRRIAFGANPNSAWNDSTYCIEGELAVPGVYKITGGTTSPGAVYAAGMTGDTGTTPANRIVALGEEFMDLAAVTCTSMSSITLAGQDTTGRSYLDLVQEIADSEQGIFYIDRLGDPKLRGADARATGASVTVTVSATQDLAGDFNVSLDDALYANSVVATSPAGSVMVQNSTLVTADGAFLTDQWSCLVDDETDMGTSATRRLNLRKSNKVRPGRVVVDLLTSPNSIESAVLQLVPLDRVRVSDIPSGASTSATLDGFVEGWELAVSTSIYRVELDLSPVE